MQMGLHPQKCFLPVLPLPLRPRAYSFTPNTLCERNVLTGRSDILSRRLTADQVPILFLALSIDWQENVGILKGLSD